MRKYIYLIRISILIFEQKFFSKSYITFILEISLYSLPSPLTRSNSPLIDIKDYLLWLSLDS